MTCPVLGHCSWRSSVLKELADTCGVVWTRRKRGRKEVSAVNSLLYIEFIATLNPTHDSTTLRWNAPAGSINILLLHRLLVFHSYRANTVMAYWLCRDDLFSIPTVRWFLSYISKTTLNMFSCLSSQYAATINLHTLELNKPSQWASCFCIIL